MSATGGGWDDDDRLQADLGDAVRGRRAVPDRFVEVGKAAFVWRDVDADLASLQYDSAVSGLPAGVRAGPAAMRALGFEAAGTRIEVEISATAIMGQVIPARAGSVEIWADGAEPRAVELDAKGWFDLGPAPARPFRLCVRGPAGVVLSDRVSPAGDQPPS